MSNNSIADCCWRVVMRSVFLIAYATAALIWVLFIWVASFMSSTIDGIALVAFGGLPFGALQLAERLISRKSKQSES